MVPQAITCIQSELSVSLFVPEFSFLFSDVAWLEARMILVWINWGGHRSSIFYFGFYYYDIPFDSVDPRKGNSMYTSIHPSSVSRSTCCLNTTACKSSGRGIMLAFCITSLCTSFMVHSLIVLFLESVLEKRLKCVINRYAGVLHHIFYVYLPSASVVIFVLILDIRQLLVPLPGWGCCWSCGVTSGS